MDIVTLGAALNGSAEYVNSHFVGGSNIQIVDNPDGTQTINASGEVSAEDTVARADIAAIKDGETLDSFGDVETALATKANTSTTYTKTEVDTALSAKQNTISDLTTIRSGAALGATAVQPETGKGLSTNDYTTAEKTKLAGIAEGAEVNEIEGIKVNNTSVNPDANKVVNITVPTTAADVSALPDTTKYAVALSLTINSSTFVMTGQLKDQNGDNLGTAQTIDLPLESVVVGGSYNSQTKKVVLTLQNGNTIEFSVADLVSGLQTELSASNKLNPAYINYDSTHRAVSDTEKSTWNGKQNALTTAQLAAVNSGIDSAKVEQIETNKNNISYNTNNGVKNYLPINSGATTGAQYVFDWVAKDIPAGQYIISFSTTATSGAVAIEFGDSNTSAYNRTGYRIITLPAQSAEVTVENNTHYVRLFANAALTITEIMLRPASISDSSYQPYALPNTAITPALQECVDNGKKNLAKIGIPTGTYGDITITVNSDGSLTLNGTDTHSTAQIIVKDIGIVDQSTYFTSSKILEKNTEYVCKGSGNSNVNIQIFAYNTSSDYSIVSNSSTDNSFNSGNYTYYCMRINIIGGSSFNNVKIYPFVCEKSLYDVSPQFEPYAMTNVELTAKEQTNENNISNRTGDGVALTANTNLNDIVDYGQYPASTAVTATLINLPDVAKTSKGRLLVLGAHVASNLRVTQIWLCDMSTSTTKGKIMMRQKYGDATWTNWFMFEGTEIS